MITKKEIQILAKDSYTNNQLDEKKVLEFSSHMDRKALKAYIRALSAIEKKNNVIIATPSVKSYNTNKEVFEQVFAGKNIIAEEDKSLLLGLRVTDNDMIFEKSLKQILENMVSDIGKNYN